MNHQPILKDVRRNYNFGTRFFCHLEKKIEINCRELFYQCHLPILWFCIVNWDQGDSYGCQRIQVTGAFLRSLNSFDIIKRGICIEQISKESDTNFFILIFFIYFVFKILFFFLKIFSIHQNVSISPIPADYQGFTIV